MLFNYNKIYIYILHIHKIIHLIIKKVTDKITAYCDIILKARTTSTLT